MIRHAPSGFTLVELLVVIAITALLMSVVMPALGKARDTTHAIVCASHMRQLFLATQGYLGDFGYYPQPFQDDDLGAQKFACLWFNALDDYLGEPHQPYATQRNHAAIKQDPVWKSLAEPENNRTIKMNGHFGDPPGNAPGWRFYRAAEVREPTSTVVFVDGRAADIRDDSLASSFYASEGMVGLRHAGGANVAFADGHGDHVTQLINPALLAPGWFTEATGRQELVWDFDR